MKYACLMLLSILFVVVVAFVGSYLYYQAYPTMHIPLFSALGGLLWFLLALRPRRHARQGYRTDTNLRNDH